MEQRSRMYWPTLGYELIYFRRSATLRRYQVGLDKGITP
jgi:hypothetical protein